MPDSAKPLDGTIPKDTAIMNDQRDIFICHASEDKAQIVVPIVDACRQANISFWYDDSDIGPGQSISGKINEGLTNTRYLLVVLSSSFLKKKFAQGELDARVFRMLSEGSDTILPIIATTLEEEIRLIQERFPLLANRKWIPWEGEPGKIIQAIRKIIFPGFTSRVCFISSEYPPHIVGGLGVHVKQLTDELSRHINIDIVLPEPKKRNYITADPMIRLRPLTSVAANYKDLSSWLFFSKAAANHICDLPPKERPDIIHCHDWVTVLAGIKCKFHLNIPLVFHLHLPNKRPLCAAIENLGLACADLITVNSQAMRIELDYRGGAVQGGVEVVKNGVNLDTFQPCGDWPAEDNYILFVGRLVEQKGVEYLLRAFYFVRQKFDNVRLKIAGEGGYQEMLMMLARNLTIADQVDFVGWKGDQDLVALYQKAMLVVVPSIYEPFGMIALEALACKRPVIVSRQGGLQEIIKHKVNGFQAEPKDDLDLAQWIMSLLSDPDLRRQMGEKGQEQISEQGYTWPSVAQHYIKLYERIKETAPNKNVSAKAQEFKQQVVDLAKKNMPYIRPFAEFLNTLFK